MPTLTAPCSNLDCGQPQGHHAGTPQPTVPGSRKQQCDDPSTAHQSQRQSTPPQFRTLQESSRHHLKRKQGMSH